MLAYFLASIYLCTAFQKKALKFGLWCNGSTTGFGSVCPGSNPGSPTASGKREVANRDFPLLLYAYTISNLKFEINNLMCLCGLAFPLPTKLQNRAPLVKR